MNNLYQTSLFVTLFFIIQNVNALELYWVGSSGNFNDNNNWHIGSINGPVSSQAPISSDNCYFMGSALNTGTPITVTFSSNSSCKSFFVDSLINDSSTVTFENTNSGINFDVYGSFHLSRNSVFAFLGLFGYVLSHLVLNI